MARVELSEQVKEICRENYETNCNKCPIRPSCVTRQPVRTQEDLDNHTTRINAHAARVMREREGQADIFDYL